MPTSTIHSGEARNTPVFCRQDGVYRRGENTPVVNHVVSDPAPPDRPTVVSGTANESKFAYHDGRSVQTKDYDELGA